MRPEFEAFDSYVPGLAIALAVGLLIGAEREWSQRYEKNERVMAGIRTFGLLGLLGAVAVLLSDAVGQYAWAFMLVAVGLLVVAGYIAEARATGDWGMTTEVAMLLTFGLGIMAACLDEIMPYMAERKQFGQPIGNFQLMQGKIADMYTAMNSARAYVYEVAKACDRGDVTRQDAAACCLYASEEAMKQAHQAVQAMGGAGFLSDAPVARIFRDAKLMEIGAGTSEIRRMLVGRELMGAMV